NPSSLGLIALIAELLLLALTARRLTGVRFLDLLLRHLFRHTLWDVALRSRAAGLAALLLLLLLLLLLALVLVLFLGVLVLRDDDPAIGVACRGIVRCNTPLRHRQGRQQRAGQQQVAKLAQPLDTLDDGHGSPPSCSPIVRLP